MGIIVASGCGIGRANTIAFKEIIINVKTAKAQTWEPLQSEQTEGKS